MSRIAYVNGRYLSQPRAVVPIEDRGYQFGDGVYEVCEVRAGQLVDERRHLDRLERSLREIAITMPLSRAALALILRETVARNLVRDGLVYIQVTRGVARRDHAFPPDGTPPSLIVTARSSNMIANERMAGEGIAVITMPDERWARVDIKSIGLLPNVLAKQAARKKGAREAWLVDKAGRITEGSSSNAWIVNRDGKLLTRALDRGILAGVTRAVLLNVIEAQGVELEERSFTVEEAYAAREAFVTSASQSVMPVVCVDGHPIGNGEPGLIACALRREYHSHTERS